MHDVRRLVENGRRFASERVSQGGLVLVSCEIWVCAEMSEAGLVVVAGVMEAGKDQAHGRLVGRGEELQRGTHDGYQQKVQTREFDGIEEALSGGKLA